MGKLGLSSCLLAVMATFCESGTRCEFEGTLSPPGVSEFYCSHITEEEMSREVRNLHSGVGLSDAQDHGPEATVQGWCLLVRASLEFQGGRSRTQAVGGEAQREPG